MAKPATVARIREAFKRFDINNLRWYPGWPSRGYGGFDPIGVVNHHTASPDSDGMVRYLADGRGPLCNFGIRENGQVIVYSLKTTYHGGMCMASRLDMLEGGTFSLSRTQWAPSNGTANANRRAWGYEALKGWNEPFTRLQLDSMIKLNAAMCWAQGWGQRVAAHGEITRRKTGDPNVNIGVVRTRTADLLANGSRTGDMIIGSPSPPALLPTP